MSGGPVPAFLAVLLVAAQLSQSPGAPLKPVRQWTDFGSAYWGNRERCVKTGERVECGISEKEAAFLATNYEILSLEKCFGQGTNPKQHNSTVASFVTTARQIKRQKGNIAKVLFYWASDTAFADCYEKEFGGDIIDHPEWWLKGASGKPYKLHNRPYIDFKNQRAVEWWISVLLKVYFFADGAMDGVFLDASTDYADFLPGDQFPENVKTVLNIVHHAAIKRAAQALKAVNPNLLVFGNSLTLNQDSNGIQLLKEGILDGVCAEHFGAFEWVDAAGLPVISVVQHWLNILQQAAAIPGKTVLVKAWIGPETWPIDGKGPSWPGKFLDPKTHKPLNKTNAGLAQAASDFVDYALAAFLCVAEPTFLFSYTWWYDISQGDVPGEDAPKHWYPQLKRPVGNALGKANIQPKAGGILCTRSYEGADISVDLHNWNSAVIKWKQTT